MGKLTLLQVSAMMEEVTRVRYTNLTSEKSLCDNLLKWGTDHEDAHVLAFSHTYLGDYYFAKGDSNQCMTHLNKARDIADKENDETLLVRIYSLLGLYYESIADEQSSLKYYMESLTFCRATKNKGAEALVLNNIAYYLQRHQGFDEALSLYQQAFELLNAAEGKQSTSYNVILNNLATVSILMKHIEEAKSYILLGEVDCKKFPEYELFLSQCWCQYYAAIEQEEQALFWADRLLKMQDNVVRDHQITFDIFAILFDSMMDLKNKVYAKRFLEVMDLCHTKSADRNKQLEIARITFCIAFETDEDKLNSTYKLYSQRIRELEQITNEVVTSGLKDSLSHYYVSKQKEALETEKDSLDDQVNIDELTMVYTRRYLDTLTLDIPNRNIHMLGFIMLDVDCLKEFNDTYGHVEGDKALRFVGSILKKYVTTGIFPCRFGGDEFVCLCMDVADTTIENYIQAIRKDLDEEHIVHETSHCAKQVTLSIGYANETYLEQMDSKAVLQLADQALYTSKLHGRNTYSKA